MRIEIQDVVDISTEDQSSEILLVPGYLQMKGGNLTMDLPNSNVNFGIEDKT